MELIDVVVASRQRVELEVFKNRVALASHDV